VVLRALCVNFAEDLEQGYTENTEEAQRTTEKLESRVIQRIQKFYK
jgi:hypothetical protein